MARETILRRAAIAVIQATDFETNFYEGQSAVEDWALDALNLAIVGNYSSAKKLLDRYQFSAWTHEECNDQDHDSQDPTLHRRWYEDYED